MKYFHEDTEELYEKMVSSEGEGLKFGGLDYPNITKSLGKQKPLFLTDLTEKKLFVEAVARSKVDESIFPGVC